MTQEDTLSPELVGAVETAIEAAELDWKAANGGDDVSTVECPDNVKARAALTAALPILREQDKKEIEELRKRLVELAEGQADIWEIAKASALSSAREWVLRDMMEPSEEMLLAANAATASWMNVKGSQLTVNKAKHRGRFQAMLRAFAKSRNIELGE